MKRLRYAGGSILIGDAVAHAVLAYGRDLALARASDTVMLVGRTDDGGESEGEMLLGPASQLFADTAEGPESLPGDEASVADIEERRGRLTAHPVRVEDQQSGEDADWYNEWSGDDAQRTD